MGWQDSYQQKHSYQQKRISVEQAAAKIQSGQRVLCSASASAPATLIEAICRRRDELEDVTMTAMLVQYPLEYLKGSFRGRIRHHAVFVGPLERKLFPEGNIDVTSYAFSHSDWLVKNRLRPDVYLAEVSPPDADGNMSLGPIGTFYTAPALECAKTVIVQVNRKTPYVHGTKDAFLNVRDVTWICEADHDLAAFGQPCPTETEQKIAEFILPYFEDGVTFQLGIGGRSQRHRVRARCLQGSRHPHRDADRLDDAADRQGSGHRGAQDAAPRRGDNRLRARLDRALQVHAITIRR